MSINFKLDIHQQIVDQINIVVKKIVDEEFEAAKQRIDQRRKELYELTAIEMTREMKVEIVGEDLVFHLMPIL